MPSIRPRPPGALASWPDAAIIYCIAGIWTDTWWDNPVAWKSWVCAFHGWSEAEWQQFATLWAQTQQLAPPAAERARSALMATYRVYFYNWRRTPGGSTHGDVRHAARQVRADLQTLRNVVLVGHSKGGAVIKYLLGADWPWDAGTRPLGAIFVDAPLDPLRELVGSGLPVGPASDPALASTRRRALSHHQQLARYLRRAAPWRGKHPGVALERQLAAVSPPRHEEPAGPGSTPAPGHADKRAAPAQSAAFPGCFSIVER